MSRLPSPAMTVALIALGVALTGGAQAGVGLITGTQIKDHSIGFNDLAPGAVARLHGLRGPQGSQGAQGPVGPVGAVGANGGFDPAKVGYYPGPSAAMSPGQTLTLIATCPAGTKVVGGGGFVTIADTAASEPLPNGAGWYLIAQNNSSIVLSNLFAVAVCAAP